MAIVTTKSPAITNLDAIPYVPVTTGEGNPGFLRQMGGHVQALTTDSVGSIYRLLRLPTNAKVKSILLTNTAGGATGALDIDVAFSDSTLDSTPPSLQGGVVQITGPVDNKLFGAAVAITAAQKHQDQTFANQFFTAGNDFQNLPLWQVLVNLGATQFSADPGGNFDIVGKLTTVVAATTDLWLEGEFVM